MSLPAISFARLLFIPFPILVPIAFLALLGRSRPTKPLMDVSTKWLQGQRHAHLRYYSAEGLYANRHAFSKKRKTFARTLTAILSSAVPISELGPRPGPGARRFPGST